MSLANRIAETLQTARRGAFGESAARPLDGHTPAERLGAVAAEIGQTVMPRRLVISSSDGREIVLHAASRRLQRIELFVPAELAAAGDPIFAQRIEADLADQLRRLGALFAAFAGADGPIRVESDEPPFAYSADAVGFTTQELLDAAAAALEAEGAA